MKKFDRKKFKASPVKALKQKSFSGSNDGQYLSIKPGRNIFRLYPAHPDDPTKLWKHVKEVVWLTKTIEKDGKEEKIKKPIFNANVHSKHPNSDIVITYVNLAEQAIRLQITDEDEQEIALSKLKGSGKYWREGLKHKKSFVVYGEKITGSGSDMKTAFGRINFPLAVDIALNQLMDEDEDEEINLDPFTDPDDGLCVIVKYDKDASSINEKYQTTIDVKKKYSEAISDEKLQSFMKKPPLSAFFVNAYTQEDFEYSVEALAEYDVEHGFGVFEMEEFQELLENLSDAYPTREEVQARVKRENIVPLEDKKEEKSSPKSKKEAPNDLPWEDDEEEQDEPIEVKSDRNGASELLQKVQKFLETLKRKSALSTFAKEVEIDITVRGREKDVIIAEIIDDLMFREEIQGEDLSYLEEYIEEEAEERPKPKRSAKPVKKIEEPEPVEEEPEEDDESEEVEKSTSTPSKADRLAALKAKMKAAKENRKSK